MLDRFRATVRRVSVDRRGAIAVITALAATALMGFTGLAVDVAMWELTKNKMQGAADQAAIGAVTAYLAGGGADTTSQAKAISANYGFTHGQNGATVSVTPVTPSPTGYDAAFTVTITQPQTLFFSGLFVSGVTVGATAEAATISNGPCVLSLNGSASGAVTVSGSGTLTLTNCDMDVNSTSSSDAVDSGGACIFAQNMNVGGGTSPTPSTGTGCTAGAIRYSGKYKTGTTTADPYANRTKPTAAVCPGSNTGPTHDPTNPSFVSYNGGWPGPFGLATTAQSSAGSNLLYFGSTSIPGISPYATNSVLVKDLTTNKNLGTMTAVSTTNNTVTLSSNLASAVNQGDTIQFTIPSGVATTIYPGTYCGGITIPASAHPTLAGPGSFVMTGNVGFVVQSGTPATNVSSTGGVTIFLTSSGAGNCGKIDVSGSNTVVNLTAPTSGATAGIALWVDNTIANCPANTQVSFTGGSTVSVTGAIYAPKNTVTYSGGSSAGNGCTQIISDKLTISGPSYFQHNCSGTGVSDPANSARISLIQ